MKDFILVLPNYAVSYPCVFPLIKDGRAVIGVNSLGDFIGDKNLKGLCRWINSLGVVNPKKRYATEHFTEEKYPMYDNFEAREVSKSNMVPCDYDGLLGVPTSYLDNQIEGFKIIGMLEGCFSPINDMILGHRPILNGKNKFTRILIQNERLHSNM